MIQREIAPHLQRLFGQYPFVTVTGPRQSGKTTLCRATFGDLAYADLERPRTRAFASTDPEGFLAQFPGGAVLDEVHRLPELLSYLKVIADEKGRNGLFVLTGSEQFGLLDSVSQSLAGRTAILRLLPFTLAERRLCGVGDRLEDVLYSGGYPRIHDQDLNPSEALGAYYETYVERDARRVGQIRNLDAFDVFVRLCAGRIGQLVNLSALGADAGVTHATAAEWLSVLVRCDIVFRLPPLRANIRKRLTKTPKVYFHDVGLASHLLGIEDPRALASSHMRGALFENLVVSEALKHRYNRVRRPNLSFYRDSSGRECDLIYQRAEHLTAIEIKSGMTVASDWFKPLARIAEDLPEIAAKVVVYGGTEAQRRTAADVIPYAGFAEYLQQIDAEPYPAAALGRAAGGGGD
ncbi:MAG: ATP-binding protein [Acidimicrobiia bacterium]|nr:ATP-binding protein [bacterium]MXZ30848.1 ATP-binding protein [Acidimicrobiia bacterium]MYE67384.1 ATP-binding protein [Acidimicrobiia bacterium]MYJ13028.1 ATP-binding protein [Acidimicrobiia bacterium]